MNKKKKSRLFTTEFHVKTFYALIVLVIVGILLTIWATRFPAESIKRGVISLVGQSLFSAGIISVILEFNTIQQDYTKVRDNLYLKDPSFIDFYSKQEIDTVLQYALARKFTLETAGGISNLKTDIPVEMKNELLFPLIENTAKDLGQNGFYCSKHSRNIQINPISGKEYRYTVALDVTLKNITSEEIKYTQHISYYFISQEQIDSFSLTHVQIGNEDKTSNTSVDKKVTQNISTSKHPFNYFIEFDLPIVLPPYEEVNYIVNYEYANFETACFLTYGFPFITKSYREVYMLEGPNADNYQIHAAAYSSYKNKRNNGKSVNRLNEKTLTIESDQWTLPGNGMVAIVRAK